METATKKEERHESNHIRDNGNLRLRYMRREAAEMPVETGQRKPVVDLDGSMGQRTVGENRYRLSTYAGKEKSALAGLEKVLEAVNRFRKDPEQYIIKFELI